MLLHCKFRSAAIGRSLRDKALSRNHSRNLTFYSEVIDILVQKDFHLLKQALQSEHSI